MNYLSPKFKINLQGRLFLRLLCTPQSAVRSPQKAECGMRNAERQELGSVLLKFIDIES